MVNKKTKYYKRLILFVLISICFCNLTFNQSIEELEIEKGKRKKSIELTNRLYKDAKKNTQASLNQLQLINSKIGQRNNVISDINKQIRTIDYSIINNENKINKLEKELKDLKNEYAKLIYYSYKNRNSYNKMMFILASENFNSAFKRIKYLQQYTKYRKEQAEGIKSTTNDIELRNNELIKQKERKNILRIEKQDEIVFLSDEKTEQNQLMSKMEIIEDLLRTDLENKRRIYNELENEIARIIRTSTSGDTNEENTGKNRLTAEEELISVNFANNFGKIAWPTERGIIVERFGVHKHPALKKVKVENKGINISTVEGSEVRSVFDGIVKKVFVIPGANAAVIISHGEYLTVYQNLKDVHVLEGESVNAQQPIGIIYTNKDRERKSVLHFEIWNLTKYIDPEPWLTKYSLGM